MDPDAASSGPSNATSYAQPNSKTPGSNGELMNNNKYEKKGAEISF